MQPGWDRVKQIAVGSLTATDHSSLRAEAMLPILEEVPVEVGCLLCLRRLPFA